MSQSTDTATRLLQTARFAADRHRTQRRKGVDAAPYINHPIEVADFLASVGGVTDLNTLIAALLHDVVEDTPTPPQEVENLFGTAVRALVEEMSDDKTLPKDESKRLQIIHAPSLSRHAKEIKVADKISNVLEIINDPPTDWTLERKREYLEWACEVVKGCRGANKALDRRFDEVLRDGLLSLGVAMLPRVGDLIYVQTELHLSHAIDDVRGGLAEVTKVTYETAGEKPFHWLTLKEVPGIYKWESYLEPLQCELKVKFGTARAHTAPDYRMEFNDYVIEQVDEALLSPISTYKTEPEGKLILATHLFHLYRLLQNVTSSLNYVSKEIKGLPVTPEVRSRVENVCGRFLEKLIDAKMALEVIAEKLNTSVCREVYAEACHAVRSMESSLQQEINGYHELVLSLRENSESQSNAALTLCQGLGIDIITGYRRVVDRIDSIAGALEGQTS